MERNGFPRKWNLKDHMKRVHGWEESEDSPSSDSPPGPSRKSGQPVWKRKGTSPVASVLVKRQRSSQTTLMLRQFRISSKITRMSTLWPALIPRKQPESEAPFRIWLMRLTSVWLVLGRHKKEDVIPRQASPLETP
jgi:hypothetical protein